MGCIYRMFGTDSGKQIGGEPGLVGIKLLLEGGGRSIQEGKDGDRWLNVHLYFRYGRRFYGRFLLSCNIVMVLACAGDLQECSPLKNSCPKTTKADTRRKMPDVRDTGRLRRKRKEKDANTRLVYAHDKGKSILTSLPVVQNYDSYSLIELEDKLVSSSNTFIDYLKIKKKEAIEGDEMPNNATTTENIVVSENVADESVVVRDNVCGEAREDEGNVDIIGSVSLIPTAVIDEFIEGILTPEPKNSPAGLSTCSPFYGGAHQGDPQNEMCLIKNKMKKLDDLFSEIERNFNEALFNYPDDDGIKDAMVEWRSKLLKFGKKMGDDNANHSDKDHNLDNNTKDPFDSTQHNISCSMMEELENSVL
ncbi:hypothetical protein R6Q57_005674, partial [Mikania cordata]